MRVHRRVDHAVRRLRSARLGDGAAVRARPSDAPAAADGRAWHRASATIERAVLRQRMPGRRSWRPRVTTRARPWRRSPSAGGTAFLSSGTWSLLGTEVGARRHQRSARELNFTNEGGVCGTTRLLKNIAGLWLLQACRRRWAAAGQRVLLRRTGRCRRRSTVRLPALFDPDHPSFLHPDDMPSAIATYCRETGQAEPSNPPAYTRAILESLAFKYRVVLESLEGLTEFVDRGDSRRRRRRAQPAAQSVHRGRDRPHGHRRACRGDRARQHRHADAGDGRGRLARRGARDHRPFIPGRALRAGATRNTGARTTSDFGEYLEFTCA